MTGPGEQVGTSTAPWAGTWVLGRLGITLHDAGPDGADLRDLVGLALRRNPRRAHLPVSSVLGKHVPCDPRRVRAAGLRLGHGVRAVLGGEPDRSVPPSPADAAAERDAAVAAGGGRVPAVVLAYAENATALGHLVADALDADHTVHSTRRVVPGAATLGVFEERHSHASRHLLVPDDPGAWTSDLPLVLVDDELSTGRTAAATVRMLHPVHPRARYVVATLVDLRGPEDDALERAAADLGVRVDVVALARGRLELPADVLERGARLAASCDDACATATAPGHDRRRPVETVHLTLGDAPEGARHGLDRADRTALAAALPGAAAALTTALGPAPGRVLVLGCEEFLYVPVRLAEALADAGLDVRVSSTSRSPAVVVDSPSYPVRSALAFPAHDDSPGSRARFAYNVAATAPDTVVLVVDQDARTPALRAPGGLLDRLTTVAPRVVEAVVPCRPPRPRTSVPERSRTSVPARSRTSVPAGPRTSVPARRGPVFGTFAPDEVGWLLSDLSDRALETPLAEREDAVRGGRLHYPETLPAEHLPTAEYEDLFHRALARSAPRLATAVGAVTDRTLAARGPDPVLVSLARAGTPVGVLMRRWAARVRGVDLPHYTVSVVRGRGVDRAALTALTAVHDPASLVLVDGWTGKGAILDEVAADLAAHGRDTGVVLDPTVVVLADPGHCTAVHGTRDDVLVPSACLNATVSGLVSRTVRRPDLVAPGAFDGAKFYPGLRAADRTAVFLDAVTACFPAPGPPPTADVPVTVPDRRGPRYVTALARDLGVADEHRVKPGIGEATRALLRRAPAVVLVADDAGDDLDHVRLLCRDRGVPVADLPARAGGVDRPYRCVALLDPVRSS